MKVTYINIGQSNTFQIFSTKSKNYSDFSLFHAWDFFLHQNYVRIIDPRGRPQSWPVVITIFTQSVRPSVRPSQNFKIKRQSLPAGTVGWPSGSLMTPVLWAFMFVLRAIYLWSFDAMIVNSAKFEFFRPFLANFAGRSFETSVPGDRRVSKVGEQFSVGYTSGTDFGNFVLIFQKIFQEMLISHYISYFYITYI